jgi:DNA-directed RNA polymerase subunit N (RpoN/RPB10)
MALRMQHCFNCGKELGVFETWPGDLDTCGSIVCDREARHARQAEESEARERAEQDGYERYR